MGETYTSEFSNTCSERGRGGVDFARGPDVAEAEEDDLEATKGATLVGLG